MRLDELRGRRVALLGFGADVRAALPHVLEVGPSELLLADDDPARAVDAPAEVHRVDLDDAARRAEVLVRSPGYPRYRPAVEAAVRRGAVVTNPTDLWLGTFGADRCVVAVTGTKGKSTTTALIERFARDRGLDLGVAGNMGVPVFADGWEHRAATVAVEISSYQAADLHHLPDVAVLTSLAEDHLSWHNGYDRYVADKLRVLHQEGRSAACILVPAGDEAASAATAGWSPRTVRPPSPGDLPRHRVQNAALAAAVIEELTGEAVADDDVLAAAAGSLPGRLDVVATTGATTWVDDALASNPFAAAAALAWARQQGRRTLVLLGGADRGVDPEPLATEARRWPAGELGAIALPDNGDELASAAGIPVIGQAPDPEAAVALATDHLSGETDALVLFSPGAPTPPGRGDWRDRSAAFRAGVEACP